ncbi:hypothetical protein JCM1841_005280 [Sporobolomyces salmonicolor]
MLAHSYHPHHPPNPDPTPLDPRPSSPSVHSSSSSTSPPSSSSTSSHPSPSPSSKTSTPASLPRADLPGDEHVNPLFALGEQIHSGHLDPARVVIRENGVVVREGPPAPLAESHPHRPHSRSVRERLADFHFGHQGRTLMLDDQAAEGGQAARSEHPSLHDQHQEGQADCVQDFRDHDSHRDPRDAVKLKVREFKDGARETLAEMDWRAGTPDDATEGNWIVGGKAGARDAELNQSVTAILDRVPTHDGTETEPETATSAYTDAEGGTETEADDDDRQSAAPRGRVRHQPSTVGESNYSFYSAASTAAGATVESLTLPIHPPRTDSPVSFSSLAELPTPQLSTTLSSSAQQQSPPLDRSPVVHAPGHVATNSRLVPLPESLPVPPSPCSPKYPPRSSSMRQPPSSPAPPTPTTSAAPSRATPVAAVIPPSFAHPFLPQQQRQPHTSVPTSSALLASNSSPLPPPQPNSNLLVTPSPMRRSHTTGSPSPSPSPSRSARSASTSAFSTAPSSGPGRRPSVSSSRLSPSLAAGPGQPSYINPLLLQRSLSTGQLPPNLHPSYPAGQPVASTSQHPYSSAPLHPAVLDDVESSIAAQAEAIRRQRHEKRLEAEKSASQDRLALGRPGSPSAQAGVGEDASASATGVGLGGVGLGAPMMKRRSTRLGSAQSQATAGGAEAGGRSREREVVEEKERRKDEDDGMGAGVLVGNLIGQDHANYVLMYNMLTGIRIAVSRCQAKAKRPLTDADYTSRHKFSFDIVGNELTPSVKYDFKFKDYAPWVFRELREYFFLDPSDYLVSLTAKYILSELGSPGKSGSFFYFSRDYRFIIKTIRHAEHKFLRSILKEYHEYVMKNPHTLISRFYGLHRVKLPHGRKIHFVIMNNLFPPHRDVHETYDLKGSAIGRLYPEDKAAQNPHAVLKDLNWVQRHRQLALGPEKKALFEEQLRRDTELMQKLGIMDYSLLTGIHNGVRGNSEGLREGQLSVFQPDTVKVSRKPTQIKRSQDASALRKAVQRSDPQALGAGGIHELPEHDTSTERRRFLFYQDEGGMRATGDNNEDLGVIYYLGIIDILTPYTVVKRLEHFFKGLKHDKHMISAVPPREYGDRFLAFIRSCIRGNDESLRPRMFEDEGGWCGAPHAHGVPPGPVDAGGGVPPPNVSEDDERVQRTREAVRKGLEGWSFEEAVAAGGGSGRAGEEQQEKAKVQ